MGRRQRKVPVALLATASLETTKEINWSRIEKEYAHAIPPDVRQKILEATLRLIDSTELEVDAAPAASARPRLEEIKGTAENLRKLIEPVPQLDGHWWARHLLLNQINDVRLGRIGALRQKSPGRLRRSGTAPTALPMWDPLASLSEVLISCITACDEALRKWDSPEQTLAEGEAWDRWICQLTDILSAGHLPTDHRKEKGRLDFVYLVKALQGEILPRQFRRHSSSDAALAKAIERTRPRAIGKT